MRQGSGEAMRMVRTELARRLDALERRIARCGPLGVGAEVDALCALAAEYGLSSALRLGEGLSVALGQGGRGAAIGPWIERLRDAIDCEAVDPRASDTWLASIMVRFAG